jgi:hypothetical protein
MKNVSIHEFKDQAFYYLVSREPISVKHHGKIVGFYIPVKEPDETEVQAALTRLAQTVSEVLTQSGWDEETLSKALDLSLPEYI